METLLPHAPAALLLAAATALALPAQRARTVAPVAPDALVLPLPAGQDGQEPELGVRAQLIESPNLARFLRRAKEFLERGDYPGGIAVLQDAIEGRVVRDASGRPDTVPEGGAERPEDPFVDEDDPGKAVYSADGRLYRPVLRLCHELLASMPPEGLELYRTRYEVAAERQFTQALAARDTAALEEIGRRWFATDAAARALDATADLMLDAGRFKAAAEVLRTLRSLHPRFRGGEGLPGLSALDVDLDLAVCHRFAGEPQSTAAMLQEMAERYPGASVRILGEQVPVSALADHPLFSGTVVAAPNEPPSAEPPVEFSDFDALVPVWQRRFADPKPYASATSPSNARGFVVVGASGAAGGAIPVARIGEPGNTAVRFGDRLVYLEHNRLRVHDLASGRLLAESDGDVRVAYRPDQGTVSPRIAVYDYATMAVTGDGERFYVVNVPTRRLAGVAPVLENRLVALDAATLEERWAIGHGAEVEEFRAVTFLATPTVFRDRLLVPILTRGVYALQCVDARTGEPLFRTMLHSGGTDLVRAPGCHVVVDGDTAWMLTNAGVVAAIDAYSGVVRWLRRYERLDPFRDHPVTKPARDRQPRFGATIMTASVLPGFQCPSEMLLRDGRLIFAPTDGRCLLCLDAASGEVEWLLTPSQCDYIVGDDGKHLFLAGKRLLCVELRTGIQLWDCEVPESVYQGQGRGVVFGDFVVLPGDGRLHLLRTTGNASWQTRDLPQLVPGQDALTTRANLAVFGPWLVAVHSGSVEVFGLLGALRERAAAAAPAERARLLQHAGDLPGAIEALAEALQGTSDDAERERLAGAMLSLVHEVSLAMAVVQQGEPALQLLERCRQWLTRAEDVQAWHLARIEVLRALGDHGAVQAELRALRTLATAGPR